MIDEKKLIEVIKNVQDHMKEKNKEPVPVDAREIFTLFFEMVESQSKLNEWIPCSERLPNESGYYFACVYNAEVDDYDFRKTWFAHVDDYDMEESEWRELYEFEVVTAWQPLPEPYIRKKVEE